MGSSFNYGNHKLNENVKSLADKLCTYNLAEQRKCPQAVKNKSEIQGTV